MTTVDVATPDGAAIPIEMRDSEEVLRIEGPGGTSIRVAPEGVRALYPAFDVTPSELFDAIVTELGVSTPPHAARIAEWAGVPAPRPPVDVL